MAEAMGLGSDRVEVLRAAVILRDMGNFGISNDTLYKAADMTRDEVVASFRKSHKVDWRTQAVGNSLRRVIPIIVAQQILQEQGVRSIEVPIEAHILAVADAYQKLTSESNVDAVSHYEAVQQIMAQSGKMFHSGVVEAFTKIQHGQVKGVGA